MAQFAIPDADITDGTWLDQGGSNLDMYADIAPGTPGSIGAGDDATYIESVAAPSTAACAFNLSDITDPETTGDPSGHHLRWRRGKSQAGGASINLTVQLRRGYTGEGSQGTQVTSQNDNNIPDGFTTTSYELLDSEVDNISDYTDLQIRFVADQP